MKTEHLLLILENDNNTTPEPENSEDQDSTDEQSILEACDELKDFFNNRLVESLLKATRHSLDTMRRRFFSR